MKGKLCNDLKWLHKCMLICFTAIILVGGFGTRLRPLVCLSHRRTNLRGRAFEAVKRLRIINQMAD